MSSPASVSGITRRPPLHLHHPLFVGLVGGNLPQQSYVQVDGAGGCDIPDWNDIATLEPNPSGAWCIDADVAKQR